MVKAHADFLKPGGLGMLHFIGHLGRHDTELFIRKHVFPGGWIPSLADTLVEMERCGLEVLDIENLRRHYALTLDAWAERFEPSLGRDPALDPQRFDERFRRVWRSYLVGCAEMFRSPAGYTHLFQIVFSKGNVTPSSYPMSRAHVYATLRPRRIASAARACRRCCGAPPVARRSGWPSAVRTCSVTARSRPSDGSTSASSTMSSRSMRRRVGSTSRACTSYESLVDATLPHGVMPAVVPQLKTITVGGAAAGVGIEATSFREGLVHDTLLELDVLLPDGEIVVCTPDNEHRDLFFGFPNSYGTLGYALRLRLRTLPVKPCVQVQHLRFDDSAAFLAELARRCADGGADFVDGVVFGPETAGAQRRPLRRRGARAQRLRLRAASTTARCSSTRSTTCASRDYLWRWDTDWFWCSKNFGAQHRWVRRLLGRSRLNSRTYTR